MTGDSVLKFCTNVVQWMRANTIVSVNGGRLKGTPNGIILEIDTPTTRNPQAIPSQFQTAASKEVITINAGVLGSTSIAAFTVDAPADGNWYVQSKVTIVNTTGEITNREVICTQTEESNTSTVFYSTIALAVISSTEPCTSSNYNYGPLLVFPFGNVTSTWEVLVF